MPVLILTARDHWADRVAGIDAGADDYVAKPFYMPEVVSRVRAVIRRSRAADTPVLRHGPLSFDPATGEARRDGVPIPLTTFEQRLLLFFLESPHRTIGRAEIIEHLYAQDFDRDSNTVEVFIRRLRNKLGADTIETIRGRGYRLCGLDGGAAADDESDAAPSRRTASKAGV
jgi:two-component system OmpR family response regulator